MSRAGPGFFISYSHSDKALAQTLAVELEQRGARVWIDERELRLGDSIIERVAEAVADAEFFIALVSEASRKSRWCQKELHLAVSGELSRAGVRVLPLRVGEVEMPAALKDLYYLKVDTEKVDEAADRLLRDAALHQSESFEGPSQAPAEQEPRRVLDTGQAEPSDEEPIRIVGVIRERVGSPRNDGTAGSALYQVPLRLSRTPSRRWAEMFEHYWHTWPYLMLRELHIDGDTIVIPKTTMEEIEKHHREQLRRVLARVNMEYGEWIADERRRAQTEAEARKSHDERVNTIADRLTFE